jgi:thiamine biosynthesis lipoprotein
MSNTNYCCLRCHRTFRRPSLRTTVTYRCAHCARPLTHAGMDFEAPKSSDLKGWKKVERYLQAGHLYHRRYRHPQTGEQWSRRDPHFLESTPPTQVRLARLAMRTRFEFLLVGAGAPAQLQAAGEEALDEIERCEALLSAHRDDAALFHLNARASEEAVRVAPQLLAFLLRARELSRRSEGAFDPATGALVACWRAAGERGQVPDDAAIAAARGACGLERVLIDKDAGTVRFARPGMRLDPGAIGKGYALERAAALLRENGMRSALLHGGTSTVAAIGQPPGRDSWPVAIRHPLRADDTIATALLRDGSLSVSAGHGRAFTVGGKSYGHVIDPRSGWPVAGNLLAAVIHPSALASDALSTALLVLGHDGLGLLAERCPGISLLLVREVEGGVKVETSGSGFGDVTR